MGFVTPKPTNIGEVIGIFFICSGFAMIFRFNIWIGTRCYPLK